MEFTGLMENMTKPTEELASTLEAFRVFDVEGVGTISSESIRNIMHKSLEQIPGTEIDEILENLGLIQDRVVTLEGNFNLFELGFFPEKHSRNQFFYRYSLDFQSNLP